MEVQTIIYERMRAQEVVIAKQEALLRKLGHVPLKPGAGGVLALSLEDYIELSDRQARARGEPEGQSVFKAFVKPSTPSQEPGAKPSDEEIE